MSTYPVAYDLSLPAPVDTVTALLAAQGNAWSDAIYNLEHALGLSGDAASSTGTIYAKFAYLIAAGGGIFKQATAPSSPATDDIWLDTDDTGRPLYDFRSSTWALIGANALEYSGLTIDGTVPGTDGMVPSWDVASSSIKWRTPAGGIANPLTSKDALFIGGTVSGGVAAPAELALGTTVGQLLGVVAGPALGWITPAFVNAPSGAQQGDVLYYSGLVWSRLAPGTTGQFLQTQGASSNPIWANISVSPPGSAIAAPAGSVIGDLLVFDGVNWVNLVPGTSGLFLKTNGAGALPAWAAPSSGMTNPLTTTGDVIYSSDNSGTPARLAIAGTNAANKFLGISGGAPAWQTLGGKVVDTFLGYTDQGSDPSAPSSGTVDLYTKAGVLYQRNNSAILPLGKVFGASGTGHTVGLVPDPGSSTGTAKFLREDGTWQTTPGGTGSAHVVQDEGSNLTQRGNLNFVGAGVTATDDLADNASVVTVPGYYSTVAKAGSAATQQPTMNLIDGDGIAITVANNGGSSRTDVTVTTRWSRALAFA